MTIPVAKGFVNVLERGDETLTAKRTDDQACRSPLLWQYSESSSLQTTVGGKGVNIGQWGKNVRNTVIEDGEVREDTEEHHPLENPDGTETARPP
jgi:hypothetical protein